MSVSDDIIVHRQQVAENGAFLAGAHPKVVELLFNIQPQTVVK